MAIRNITFFGDSICVGQRMSIHSGWVVKVSQKLSQEFPDIVVQNSSANGRTTRIALEAMPYEIQSHPPDILIVQFGMNDCNYWATDPQVPRVSKAAFKANLHEIYTRAKKCGVQVVVLNTNHPTAKHDDFTGMSLSYQTSNAKYNSLIREVTTETWAILNDVENAFSCSDRPPEDFLLPDGLHLNEEGHQMYFNLIYPCLRRLVCANE